MTLSNLFGEHVRFEYVHEYGNNASSEQMAQELRRLEILAAELGLDVEIMRDGNELALGFENVIDQARFRVAAFGEDYNPRAHTHTVSFSDDKDTQYRRAWTAAAEDMLTQAGVDCRTVKDNGHIRFEFDSITDHAMFVHLCDERVFHESATRRGQFRPDQPWLN